MGAPFKSMFGKTEKEEFTEEQLEKQIKELQPTMRIMEKERESMLVKYNELVLQILSMNAKVDDIKRRLKRLRIAKTFPRYDPTHEDDFD